MATDELSSSQDFATSIGSETLETPLQIETDTLRLLRQAFGVDFHLFDKDSGRIVHRYPGQPLGDCENWGELCREVARRGQVEFINEEGPFLVLAIPLGNTDDNKSDLDSSLVAVATFLACHPDGGDDFSEEARLLGFDADGITDWATRQILWTPKALYHNAQKFLERLADQRRIEEIIEETRSLSENLSSTYEEISLLYRLTQNLKLSESDQQLGEIALEWLGEVVPAEGLVLLLLSSDAANDTPSQQSRTEQLLLTHGEPLIDADQLLRLVEHLGLEASSQPFVANQPVTGDDKWPCPKVRQAVVVPLSEGDHVFGWLAAINHVDGYRANFDPTIVNLDNAEIGKGEFGSVEANLLSSVGAILGIHSGNIDLYRQQAEMFSGVVRALTSAIDAKDRYTCGHSDRVARISVRLAKELGCSEEDLNNIYLAGLLHDIGKIGIDDSILLKPGKLNEEEYEHIKSHVDVGHRILLDLKQMEEVLPVVLHHHESWDGGGYPNRLPSEEIPLSARIVAVADSYDAMSSDRPYRKGLREERIDEIFHEGSGKQWDPRVVEAFFSARADICEIVGRSLSCS